MRLTCAPLNELPSKYISTMCAPHLSLCLVPGKPGWVPKTGVLSWIHFVIWSGYQSSLELDPAPCQGIDLDPHVKHIWRRDIYNNVCLRVLVQHVICPNVRIFFGLPFDINTMIFNHFNTFFFFLLWKLSGAFFYIKTILDLV